MPEFMHDIEVVGRLVAGKWISTKDDRDRHEIIAVERRRRRARRNQRGTINVR